LLIALTLACALLFLAFRGVSWSTLFATIVHAHGEWLALASLLYCASYFARSQRWRVLLTAEQAIPSATVFWATAIGYLGNNFLPARAGDVIRAATVSRAGKLSMSFTLATTICERVSDVPTLVFISLIASFFLSDVPAWLRGATRVAGPLGVVAFAFLLFLPRLDPLLGAWTTRLPIPSGLGERVHAILEQFLLGLRAIQQVRRATAFIAITVCIWLIDAAAATTVARSLDLSMSLALALLLLASLGIASAAPSTPGYVGVYQFVAVSVLAPVPMVQSQALAYIIVLQGVLYIIALSLGLSGLFALRNEGIVTNTIPENS
jgi:uncharacterized protein (TIRG00374 family)